MEVLGVGPTELIFVIIIALIILGPKDMVKAGSAIRKWLNSIIHSDTWKVVRKTSDELRRLPTQLMSEDSLEKFLTEDKQRPPTGTNAGTWSGRAGTGNVPPHADPSTSLRTSPSTSLRTSPSAVSKNENIIHPPVTVTGPPVETLKPVAKKPAAKPRAKSTTVKKTEKKPAKKTVTPTRAPKKKSNA